MPLKFEWYGLDGKTLRVTGDVRASIPTLEHEASQFVAKTADPSDKGRTVFIMSVQTVDGALICQWRYR